MSGRFTLTGIVVSVAAAAATYIASNRIENADIMIASNSGLASLLLLASMGLMKEAQYASTGEYRQSAKAATTIGLLVAGIASASTELIEDNRFKGILPALAPVGFILAVSNLMRGPNPGEQTFDEKNAA